MLREETAVLAVQQPMGLAVVAVTAAMERTAVLGMTNLRAAQVVVAATVEHLFMGLAVVAVTAVLAVEVDMVAVVATAVLPIMEQAVLAVMVVAVIVPVMVDMAAMAVTA